MPKVPLYGLLDYTVSDLCNIFTVRVSSLTPTINTTLIINLDICIKYQSFTHMNITKLNNSSDVTKMSNT